MANFAAQTRIMCYEHPVYGAMPEDKLRSGVEDIAALKQQPGKDIYLMGGAHITASFIDAGLVDGLRLSLIR